MAEATTYTVLTLDPPPEYKCINCCAPFNEITGAVNEIHIYSAANEFEKSVTILDAMAEVFDTTMIGIARSSNYNILMCSKCAETLSYLYKYYLNFIGFSNSTAYVCKLIKQVERLHLQGQRQLKFFQENSHDFMELEISTDGEESIAVSEIEYLETDVTIVDEEGAVIVQMTPELIVPNSRSPRKVKQDETPEIESPIKLEPAQPNRKLRRGKGKLQIQKKVAKGKVSDEAGTEDPSKKKRIRYNQGIIKPRFFKCHFPSCDHSERFNYKLHEHIFSEHEKKDKAICSCGFSFYPEIYKMETHKCHKPPTSKLRKGDVTIFPCEICGTIFKGGRMLSEHLEKMHVTEEVLFTCPRSDCRRKLDTRKQLIFHFDNHTESRTHLCSECGMTFKLASTLRRHLEVHTIPLEERIRMNRERMDRTKGPVGSYECDKCHNVYGRKSYLDIHVQFVHETSNWKYKCPICEKPVPSVARLNKHTKTHDPTYVRPRVLVSTQEGIPKRQRNLKRKNTMDRPFVCSYCNRKFKFKAFLLAHQKTEHTEKKISPIPVDSMDTKPPPLKSPDETEIFSLVEVVPEQPQSEEDLKDLVLKNFRLKTETPKPWNCDQCPKTFSSSRAFGIHYKTHTGEVVLTQNCPIPGCEEEFANKRQVESHLRKNHPIEEVKALPLDVLKELGLDLDTIESKKRFQCEICSNMFCSQAYLVRHIKGHSGLHRKIKCPLCDYKTSTRTLLRSHMRTNHPEDIPEEEKNKWTCDICQKSFAGQRNLKEHRLIHTGEIFRFECPVCEEKFRSKTSQISHIHAKHAETLTEEELDKYKCPECQKRFNCRKNLTEHSKMHKGNHLKVSCELCEKKFRHQGVLKTHMQAIHGNKGDKRRSSERKSTSIKIKTPKSTDLEEKKPEVKKKRRGRPKKKRKVVKVKPKEEIITPDNGTDSDPDEPETRALMEYMEERMGKKLVIKLEKVD